MRACSTASHLERSHCSRSVQHEYSSYLLSRLGAWCVAAFLLPFFIFSDDGWREAVDLQVLALALIIILGEIQVALISRSDGCVCPALLADRHTRAVCWLVCRSVGRSVGKVPLRIHNNKRRRIIYASIRPKNPKAEAAAAKWEGRS